MADPAHLDLCHGRSQHSGIQYRNITGIGGFFAVKPEINNRERAAYRVLYGAIMLLLLCACYTTGTAMFF